MSATGKSTVITGLSSLSYKAVDLDSEAWSIWVNAAADPAYPDNEVQPGKDWVWNEPRVLELLSTLDTDLLFLSGCASNMDKFYSYFDHIVLLTAPDDVIIQRLSQRQGTAYGRTDEEVARVLRLKQSIEPLLREGADLEIDTSIPGRSIVELILRHVSAEKF